MLEMVPLVGKTTWDAGLPQGMEDTGELETNGGFRVVGVGIEG